MRGLLGAVMLLGLTACQSHHGIVVLVENDNKEVRSIRLFVGTGDSESTSLTPSSKVQVDDAEYWIRDPGNESDLVDVSDQAELRFVFETDAAIPVAIAVGYDASGQPIAAGLAHDLAPMDGTDFSGYELTLVSPISAIGPAGGPMQIALWGPPPMMSQLDASCAGVIVAGEDHPYFVVSEDDQDCDGLRDDNPLECNPDVFLGERAADPSEASCLVPGTGSAGEMDCQLGGQKCTDNVPRGQGACDAGHTCMPHETCNVCGSSFECAADLAATHASSIANVAHYECTVSHKSDGSVCNETFKLERPPTGGYDCTAFEIGDATSPLADKLDVDQATIAAAMHNATGSSCAAELTVSGTVGDTTFTGLVAFTLKNKAGVALPVAFVPKLVTTCPGTDSDCELLGTAYSDPALTECAAQWTTIQVASGFIGPGGDSSDVTLTADQLTAYFISNGMLFTSHRTAVNGPWGVAMAVGFAGQSAFERLSLPKVSGDGTRMFVSTFNTMTGVKQLAFTTIGSGPLDWTVAMPVIYLGATTMHFTSATFGPNNTVIVAGYDEANLNQDLFEATFDETTLQIDAVQPLLFDSQFTEDAPLLSPDGLQLYFQSDATSLTAPYVVSRKNVDDDFVNPVRLDELEGGGPSDGAPWVSPGGRTIYFTRQPGGGPTRVWTATRTSF